MIYIKDKKTQTGEVNNSDKILPLVSSHFGTLKKQ